MPFPDFIDFTGFIVTRAKVVCSLTEGWRFPYGYSWFQLKMTALILVKLVYFYKFLTYPLVELVEKVLFPKNRTIIRFKVYQSV